MSRPQAKSVQFNPDDQEDEAPDTDEGKEEGHRFKDNKKSPRGTRGRKNN
jgi:hypothetical protein